MSPSILIIGGTGGQGMPIVKELAEHGFDVRVLTRNLESDNSKKLATMQNVTLYTGATDDEEALRKAFNGVDYAFVNLNSWALGIKNEIFWGIRIFELAVQSGVKHYIWSSLDNYFLETRYDDSLRTGHYYGKGHVEQWMSALPQSPMRWSILTTSPYIEQLLNLQAPKKQENGEYEFRLPLGDGAIPYTPLDDIPYYVRWIVENPKESSGLNIKLSVEHVTLPQLASTFTEVTGKPAKATNITIDEWFTELGLTPGGESATHLIGSSSAAPNDQSLLTVYQNFSNWWHLYQRSGGNVGVLKRDYKLLDKIHPQRTRSLKQWMERVGYDGDKMVKVTVTSAWSL
ncbi:NAD(P)-binding protein [Microthyrium microscopicum]|uniref:NAD(P)-binding protein n=1 Tax=Microthyrium microscopicum TaxID=703497 RepID=A0A6A6UPM3_9PEZI|nr:NAD(P)-binding protein [Microthyrium microscopicum]